MLSAYGRLYVDFILKTGLFCCCIPLGFFKNYYTNLLSLVLQCKQDNQQMIDIKQRIKKNKPCL